MNDESMPHYSLPPLWPRPTEAHRNRRSPKSVLIRGLVALMLCAVLPAIAPSAASAATTSHTGSAPAVHMELKNQNNGSRVCQVYDTPASTRPVAQNCPTGKWTEQLFDVNWKQIGNKTVTVTVGDTPPPSSSGRHEGSAPAVHMELKNQNNGSRVCQVYDTPASTRPVAQNCPTGKWTEQLFDVNWKQIGNKTVTVGGGGSEPPTTKYTNLFTENFNNSSLSSKWLTPDWPESYRDADFRRDQCVVGGGILKVRASRSGSQVRSCYAHTKETFGPESGQLRIRYRVNLSRVQAEGGWFAAWLNTLSGEGNPYDGNPATGTEIDVVEYVPFNGDYKYSSNGIDTRNSFHPAVHTVDGTGGIISPETNGNGFYDAGREGINLRSGWHTFEVEWNANCQVFSVDGKDVWTNHQGVSSAKVHRLFLTMEMSDEGSDGYNQWGFASGEFAENLRTRQAEARVTWVKVDKKPTPDANLCNG